MDERLLRRLKEITEEEQIILDGGQGIQRERYTSSRDFVVDSEKMLEKGKLIEIRPHTRFVHFPRHRHNYVEVLYMCSGSTTHILNGSQKLVLQQGDLLFLNQAVYHEILPAGEEDVGVNFIILPQFFDRSFRMLEQENVLRDFLVSTLAGESAFAGWLHIEAGNILPVENLLEIAQLKALAHSAYVTELTGNKSQVRLSMYGEAPVRAEEIPGLVKSYGGALKFTASGQPGFTLTDRRNENREARQMLEKVKILLNSIKELLV